MSKWIPISAQARVKGVSISRHRQALYHVYLGKSLRDRLPNFKNMLYYNLYVRREFEILVQFSRKRRANSRKVATNELYVPRSWMDKFWTHGDGRVYIPVTIDKGNILIDLRDL